tara:strand:- start:369 stop:1052 length:684 start_codon:yes stop_codon:yes gene_type:complete
MAIARARQTKEDRERILAAIPDGTKRVQVIGTDGRTQYKRPDDILLDSDEIVLSSDGTPVVMRGRPGRKPRVQLQPVSSNVAEVAEARVAHIENAPLLKATKKDAEGDGVLHALLVGMAEESAAIEFERQEAERHGRDTSNISAKRARVLKGMADTWLKRKEKLDGGLVDLDSPAFEKLFGFVLETVRGALEDTSIRPEQIETVFNKLGKRLDTGWKADAKARMQDK